MKTIYDLNELEKDITEYNVRSSPNLFREEKEVSITMGLGENNEHLASVYATHVTGIKWCVNRIAREEASLDNLVLEKGNITSIAITTTPSFITLKNTGRKTDGISGAINNADFNGF